MKVATQLGLNTNFLKILSDKELLELLRTTGGRDKDKVIAERQRRKNQRNSEELNRSGKSKRR